MDVPLNIALYENHHVLHVAPYTLLLKNQHGIL